MFSPTLGATSERSARQLKKENRLYHFLRSRSRSQTDISAPGPALQNSHAKQSSGSKPPSRIPSRPINSTTTTDTTAALKVKRQPSSSIPVPSSTRRPETYEPTNLCRKINIFGISISKPRSRSRSRPRSPRLIDIPPPPGFDEDSQPQPPSKPSSRPAGPAPAPATARGVLATTPSLISLTLHDLHSRAKEFNGDTHPGSAKLRGFFSCKDSTQSQDHSSSSVLVSAPAKRVPSLQRRSPNKAPPECPNAPPADSCPFSPSVRSRLGSDTPRIVNAPVSTTRSATVSGGTIKSTSASANRSRFGFRNRSLDTGLRYRGTMDVVDEEGRLSRESKDLQMSQHQSSKGKGKDFLNNPVSRTTLSRTSTSVWKRKHGSFDFERPGLGAIALQRSPSNGTSTTVTSGWSRKASMVRESALGPGLAGVGTMQKDTSVKRGKEREEMAKKQARVTAVKKAMVVEEPEPGLSQMNPPAHSSNGQQTPFCTMTSGKSSSLSRASARQFLLSGNRNVTQHGLLPFESPISPLTRSTASDDTAKEVRGSWDKRTEQGKERPALKEQIRDRPIERKSNQNHRSPASVSKYPTFTTKIGSGVKGRSLDLNLGLSWAPSRVREDVLLKSSSLFNRSMNTSLNSRPVDSSVHGHNATGLKSDNIASEKLKIGREVGELFREALGEARYIRFKMYIYQFDAREISFDGPTGIISKVDALLATVPTLQLDEKCRLMDNLVRIILQNA